MQFSFTEEQTLLQESAEKLVENDYPFEVRKAGSSSEVGFDEALWQKFAELGWLGLGIPEDMGGYGGGAVETAIIMETLGKALAVEPFTSSVVMASALLTRSASPAHHALLAEIAAGKKRVAFALAERHSRYDLSRVGVTATPNGEGFTVAGTKSVSFNADSADAIVVTARTAGNIADDEGISLVLIERDAQGVSLRSYPTVDGLRAAEITFDGVNVEAEQLIGPAGAGLPLIEAAVDAGIVALSAEAAGIMKHMYESTLEYLRGREQFGVSLASLQALQHRVVDMFVATELARSMAYMAAVKLDAPTSERRRAVSAAKVQIGKSGKLVGEESIQLHGGMGMTDEMAISHYFKRLTMINTTFGDLDHHLDYLVDHPS